LNSKGKMVLRSVPGADMFMNDEVCTFGQSVNGCKMVKPIMPFLMHVFDNRIICGKKGGPSFLNATRPDFNSKLCPENTLPCSNLTSPENTLCYDKS
jgi:hypothetical protein